MKSEEDEAFDDLAKRQGGGGFKAKQAMAADKLQEPWNEDAWRRNNWRCGHGWLRGEQCEICNAPQPAQEPVAWMVYTQDGKSVYVTDNPTDIQEGQRALPLYTTPPQREWVGLTAEDFSAIKFPAEMRFPAEFRAGARWAEVKLKEKNT